ncbi:hypothetical protein [Candidatus Mycobacterium methanotrophicum]|uniref:Uncharacterized protein n=1 Tax=Candidatus Mycobacterium methanotrophicum TaxID=2943498 RepID=A0ABY4QSM8_9MYCO|nr:hypothetical protein [Candidatus Mycobacterium methanotrophicum]UQX13547.1 hypothetical protein M5I08_25485 [Candidatus Mycobacterium methanotrophicum]
MRVRLACSPENCAAARGDASGLALMFQGPQVAVHVLGQIMSEAPLDGAMPQLWCGDGPIGATQVLEQKSQQICVSQSLRRSEVFTLSPVITGR